MTWQIACLDYDQNRILIKSDLHILKYGSDMKIHHIIHIQDQEANIKYVETTEANNKENKTKEHKTKYTQINEATIK